MKKIKSFISAAACVVTLLTAAYCDQQNTPAAIEVSSVSLARQNAYSDSTKTAVYKDKNLFSVTLKNKIFSPLNTENLPKEAVFEISVLDENVKIKKWRFDLVNSQKQNVYTQEGTVIPDAIRWNALKDGKVIEGKYRYVFSVEIWKKDRVTVEDGTITVDVTPPLLLLNSSADTAVISDGKFALPVTFSLSNDDESGIDLNKTKLSVLNAKNNIEIKSWSLQNSGQQNIIWDGKDAVYERTVPAGDYKVVFTAYDNTGNVSKFSKNLSVIECNVKGSISDIIVKEPPKELDASVSCVIFFKSQSPELTEQSLKKLKMLTDLLKEYPANKAVIEGHTDSFECKKTKNDLIVSNDRAKSVYDFFIKYGINPDRLQTAGYGKDKPAVSDKDEKLRILNRRVEITVIKNEQNTDKKN